MEENHRPAHPFAHPSPVPRITPAAPPRSRWFLPVLSVEHVRPGPDGDVRLDLEQRFASRAVVQDIVSKMPSAASPSNPLADQQWVRDLASQAVKDKADKVVPAAEGNLAELTQDGNLADSGKKPADFADAENTYTKAETDEAIDRVAAYYITRNAAGDAFETKAQLNSATVFYSGGKVRTPTRNDYCVVLADETHDNAEYRYIYAVADGETTGSWQPQFPVEGVMTIDQTVTKNSTNPVASGGVWSAIWGALSAIPAGFSSLYDWCVAQLAGKASTADATLTERGFTEWDCNPSTVLVNGVNYPAVVYRLVIGRDVYWALGAGVGAPPFTAQPYDETATSLTFSLSDSFEPHTVVATREALSGYQLGSQSDKPLQPAGDYAPATNIAKTALGQDVQTSLGKADTAIQGVKVNGTEITPDAQKKVNLEVATKADATLTEKWTPTFALTDAQKEVFSQTPGASDNDYALTIVPSSSTESYLLYVGSYNAASFRKIQSDSTNLIFDGGDARLGLQPGDLVATLNGYTLGSQSDKPLASEAEAEALRTGKANRAPNPTAGNLAALDANGNPTDSGVKASDKLDSTSAAPAFSSDPSVSYAVDSRVTYNGKLYKCTAATTGGTWVAGSWTADTMTDPDAVLDITAQNQLRVVAKDGTLLWAQGYDLASTSSATLACDACNNFTFANGATSQAFTLPTAPTGKVGDFGLDIDNSANTSAATMTLTGLDSTFSVVVPEGESLNDMLAIAAGELARFYITLSTFRINDLPTWHIVKQVVENGGATV